MASRKEVARDLRERCEKLAIKRGMMSHLTCQTFYIDGYHDAIVAGAGRCIGVYGFDSELEALHALESVLRKRKGKDDGE